MGATSKPLKIIVTDEALLTTPEFEKMAAQGHVVRYHHMLDPEEVDIIFGPNARLMRLDMIQHLPVSVAGARAKKFPPKPKEAKVAGPKRRRSS